MFYDESFLWFGKVFLKLPQEDPNWLDIISPSTQNKYFVLRKMSFISNLSYRYSLKLDVYKQEINDDRK